MTKDNIMLSISIFISGLLIAGAVTYNGQSRPANPGAPPDDVVPTEIKVAPITSADHILGNINAPVKVVEFSDLECPFCSTFHPTLKKVLSDYNGKVVWVYRHFPLESIHANARKAALSSECAAEQGGNDAFWAFIDAVFADQRTSISDLTAVAKKIGLDTKKFDACVESGKYENAIDEDIKEAGDSGGRGTPWTIVINADGKTFPINGAQPYPQVKSIIEQALK